ncbi:ChaB family protein [Candidatus Babeliales bacterium]|nr:ChaB family protein [Candidatus Babeliales bacterium]
MPYEVNADLPDSIKKSLPEHAQSIFRKVFNSALNQYGNEEQAFKVAWAVVKKEYEKDDQGHWIKK